MTFSMLQMLTKRGSEDEQHCVRQQSLTHKMKKVF